MATCGCESGGPIVVHGKVVCDGQPVPMGDITFISVGSTKNTGGGAEVVDGSYRIDGRGGVLPGEYRVVINAFEKTGRKVTESNGFEPTQVDEVRRIGPKEYASFESPLLVTILDHSSNPVDIELPAD
jgi:hypothetical protein